MRHTLEEVDKFFDLYLIVVGMHLRSEFGLTAKEVVKDGFKVAAWINTHSPHPGPNDMAKILGLTISGVAKEISRLKPDLILVLGDRGEELAGAAVGAYLNIPVAHLHGGDQGDDGAHIDESIRHAITKFAHIHLPATKRSAERIIKMGEEKWRVHVIGSPALIEILAGHFLSRKELAKKFKLDFKQPLILVIQHPVSTEIGQAGWQMEQTLRVLADLKEQTVLIYPNSDAGSGEMIKIIKKYKNEPWLRIFKSLPRQEYLSLMKNSSVMVGNSSSGSIDSSSFKIPVVNVGTRESTRENGGNKIFVSHNQAEIKKAIKRALFDEKLIQRIKQCRSPYGDGKTHKRIIKIINSYFPLTENRRQKLLIKKLSY